MANKKRINPGLVDVLYVLSIEWPSEINIDYI
jgi:hypothetical protein